MLLALRLGPILYFKWRQAKLHNAYSRKRARLYLCYRFHNFQLFLRIKNAQLSYDWFHFLPEDGFFKDLLLNGKILEKMNDFGSDFSYFLLLESRIFKVSSQIMSKERFNKSCVNVQFHEKEKLHRLNYIQKIDTKYMYLSNS